MTVPEFAQHADISERTVWYDIRAGRLPSIRSPNGRRHVPRSALATYRAGLPFAWGNGSAFRRLLTVRQVSYLMNMSVRSVRRRVRAGVYVTDRVSVRRLLIDARRTRLHNLDGTRPTMLEEITKRLPLLQFSSYVRDQRQPFVEFVVGSLQDRAAHPRPQVLELLGVPLIARLSRKSYREAYDYFSTKRPEKIHRRVDSMPRRVFIRWTDAIEFADGPDAMEAIIAVIVSRYFSSVDAVLRAEITRGVAALASAGQL